MGPSFSLRLPTSARKLCSCSRVGAKAQSWVMAFGTLTEKRKSAGVEAAQRTYVDGRWGRWKEELISTHVSSKEYRSRCEPSPGMGATLSLIHISEPTRR